MKENFFNEYGFKGATDFFASITGLKDYPFKEMQFWGSVLVGLGSFLAGLGSFIKGHIWDPPEVVGFVVFLTLVNSWYGLQVSRRIYKRGFSWDKAQKTFGIIVTDLLIMAIFSFVMNYKTYYSPIGDILFGYFFTWKLRQIWVHWKLLDFQKGEFTGIFGNYLESMLKSKFGEHLINELHKDKQERENPANPEENQKVIN